MVGPQSEGVCENGVPGLSRKRSCTEWCRVRCDVLMTTGGVESVTGCMGEAWQ